MQEEMYSRRLECIAWAETGLNINEEHVEETEACFDMGNTLKDPAS